MHAVSMWKMITGTLLHNVEASLSCNLFAILVQYIEIVADNPTVSCIPPAVWSPT